jgi:hypothetical protein
MWLVLLVAMMGNGFFHGFVLLRGRLWPLVLLATLGAPWLWGQVLRRSLES